RSILIKTASSSASETPRVKSARFSADMPSTSSSNATNTALVRRMQLVKHDRKDSCLVESARHAERGHRQVFVRTAVHGNAKNSSTQCIEGRIAAAPLRAERDRAHERTDKLVSPSSWLRRDGHAPDDVGLARVTMK